MTCAEPGLQADEGPSKSDYPYNQSKSALLRKRADRVMPGGNTRTTVYRSPYPVYALSGRGSRVVDVDGIERSDFLNNYTALIHGHAHPLIVSKVEAALQLGSCFGLPTESEIKLAEVLCDRMPSCDAIRFTNSGSEAVMMAVKAARAYTGRPKIAKCEGVYHGSYDFVEVSLDSNAPGWGERSRPAGIAYSAGTPEGTLRDVVVLPFNDAGNTTAILESYSGEIAAVIIDPLPNRIGLIPASQDFLQAVRAFCSRSGTVLITDEVISFRMGYHGAQGQFGFKSDLTTFGKVIGGGFPVGAVAGRREIMSVFDPSAGRPLLPHGGTFNANPISMTAGLAAMELLTEAAIDNLNRVGAEVRARLQAVFDDYGVAWQVSGLGSLFRIVPTPTKLVDYRSSRPFGPAGSFLGAFTAALLNHQVLLDPGGLGCVSTTTSPMDVEILERGAARALCDAAVPKATQ